MQGVDARFGQGCKPIILALSNPDSKAECTAEEAYDWSNGKAVYASGTTFPRFQRDGKTLVPSQANNSLIFPGESSHKDIWQCFLPMDMPMTMPTVMPKTA